MPYQKVMSDAQARGARERRARHASDDVSVEAPPPADVLIDEAEAALATERRSNTRVAASQAAGAWALVGAGYVALIWVQPLLYLLFFLLVVFLGSNGMGRGLALIRQRRQLVDADADPSAQRWHLATSVAITLASGLALLADVFVPSLVFPSLFW